MPRSRKRPKAPPVKASPKTALPLGDRIVTGIAAGSAGFQSGLAGLESWLAAHCEWLLWPVVFLGLYLRWERAAGSFFNYDETQIMLAPLQRNLAGVYKLGLMFPYGPIVSFLLHFMTYFGSSELYFRMPALLAGTLLVVVAYRWMALTFGAPAGLVTACILSFSPSLVILSAQVRHYTIHMLLIACSLYCLERAFRDQSLKWMRLFGASLVLALLTLYMSVWYTAAIGAYALLRILRKELALRLVLEWVGIQVVVALVLVIAYFTHLYLLRGSEGETFAREVWLRSSYYHPESQSLVSFLTVATRNLFIYVFANATVGAYMVPVFLVGAVLVLWRKTAVKQWLPALSILLPLLVTASAGVMRLYPYGGSRHDAFLAIFIAAGVGVAGAFLAREKVIPMLLAGLVLAPLWLKAEERHYLDVDPQLSKLQQMRDALDFLSSRTPRPRVLVVDQQGAAMVNYYVCRGTQDAWARIAPDLNDYRCKGYEILAVNEWGISASRYPAALAKARELVPEHFPDPVWVFNMLGSSGGPTGENHAVFGGIDLRRISP